MECLNEFIGVLDCNDCQWINVTEREQEQIHHELRRDIPHKCLYYEKYLKHRTNTRDHDSYICPCDECERDKHKACVEAKNSRNKRYLL